MRGTRGRWVRGVGLGAVAALVAAGLVAPAPASAESVQRGQSVQTGPGPQSGGSVEIESHRRGGFGWGGRPDWGSSPGWHRPHNSGWDPGYSDRDPGYYDRAGWGRPAPVWIPNGQWVWNGGGWVWQPGYWR
jgi:hypothetical protein